jgi:hypothetical protein
MGHRDRANGLDGQREAKPAQDRDNRGEARVALRRERPVQALALDLRAPCHLRHPVRGGKMPERDEQEPRLVILGDRCLEVLGRKHRVLAELLRDGVVMGYGRSGAQPWPGSQEM